MKLLDASVAALARWIKRPALRAYPVPDGQPEQARDHEPTGGGLGIIATRKL